MRIESKIDLILISSISSTQNGGYTLYSCSYTYATEAFRGTKGPETFRSAFEAFGLFLVLFCGDAHTCGQSFQFSRTIKQHGVFVLVYLREECTHGSTHGENMQVDDTLAPCRTDVKDSRQV